MSTLLTIKPFRGPACGLARIPGSKSVTNRALILAALSDGETVLEGALFSRDTRILIAALQELGFSVDADESACRIKLVGLGGRIPKAKAKLHVGNAGTAARFLTAFLCLHPAGEYEIDGDDAMRARPMAGLLRALESAGAKCLTAAGSPADGFPLRLITRGIVGGAVSCDASSSSQMLSALLMVAPLAPGFSVRLSGTTVSEPFVEMTAKMCAQFGRPLIQKHGAWMCPQPGAYHAPSVYAIEPDATAASYFIALPAVTGRQSHIRLAGYDTRGLQGDTAFAAVAQACGAIIHEETGAIIVRSWSALRGGDFNFNAFSDTFLTLAALAPLFDKPVTLRGIGHTRHQETDRVLAMATELERLGVRVEPSAQSLRVDKSLDTLTIYPGREAMLAVSQKTPVSIHTYEDHRVAMSFGILGSYDLHGNGQPWISIQDPACTGKTFPYFFDALEQLRSNFLRIAVDGGAASGKSSTSRAVAAAHGLMHVDTGAHYRSITRALLSASATPESTRSVIAALPTLQLGTKITGHSAQLTLSGWVPKDAELRSPEVNAAVSSFAAMSEVRNFLFDYQQGQVGVARSAGFSGIIMEGRDIGSIIMPDAEVRIFLEADAQARTARRAAEGQADAVLSRDRQDASRSAAPLVCAEGATRIDNTRLSLTAVVETVGHLIAQARR